MSQSFSVSKMLPWKSYARLMRLDKPVGTWLLLWPTLWALWIATHGDIPINLLFIFFVGVFIMRSAGCVMNDIADRKFDPHVERTQHRPLACNEVSVQSATGLLLFLLGIALVLVLFLNWLCFGIACLGLFMTILYPFMKRWIVAPQCVLGIAFSVGIPMAFASVDGDLSHMPWLLLAIGLTWPVIYDTLYAMVDKDDDLKIGLHSTAILFGKHEMLIVNLMELGWLILWYFLGVQLDLNIAFFLTLLVIFALFFYHNRRIEDIAGEVINRPQCFKAFKSHSWVGAVLFLGLVLGKNV